jgi:Mn-dependent DtxR family transcriptional regulator
MSFTTQDMMDWAFAQDAPTIERLMLLVLAFDANPEGGGTAGVDRLAERARVRVQKVSTLVQRLSDRGLIIHSVSNGVVHFGLSISKP